MKVFRAGLKVAGLAAMLLAGSAAAAQTSEERAPGAEVAGQRPLTPVAPATTQTPLDALAQDAAEYARLNGVSLTEAIRRLRAQEESVAFTDSLRVRYKDRLAGISIEHQPDYRIVVLLTGEDPVPGRSIYAGGMTVPVTFRTGAATTQDAVTSAMRTHRDAIVAALPGGGQGMGFDPRSGELVLLIRGSSADTETAVRLEDELETLTNVPVRLHILSGDDGDFAIGGGSRVEGIDPQDGRRYACTTGFVVTDGARTGIVTAAHCPDVLTYVDPRGGQVPLSFVGGWGARHQDVQVHLADQALQPTFYADTKKSALRTLSGARRRESTRAGDAVCHRGETTGYSCSQVELTDYAPPGALCGGPCEPSWVTVTGPSCRGGDSGGPIFNGTVAFGIAKGGNYNRSGRCNFYYYMSTDYLPDGWRLLGVPVGLASAEALRPTQAR